VVVDESPQRAQAVQTAGVVMVPEAPCAWESQRAAKELPAPSPGSSSSRHVVTPGNGAFLFAEPLQSLARGSGYHEQIRFCYRDAERHSS